MSKFSRGFLLFSEAEITDKELGANSDDPWNQTPADTEEWLRKFKQDVGLL